MNDQIGYRARLRVRLGKPLTCDEPSFEMEIEGRPVTLSSQNPDVPLKQSQWVIFGAKGFASKEEASAYGNRLRVCVDLAALSARIGVDTGKDEVTTWADSEWARNQGIIGANEKLAPNVHGLSIIPDTDLIRFPLVTANATVSAAPENFTGAIIEAAEQGVDDLGANATGIRLLNSALMNPDPLAQVVLSFSAVEALGQDERWSKRQQSRIDAITETLQTEGKHGDLEMNEVADAVGKLHKISLRQGVLRVLDHLDLSDFRKEWDRLYGIRSGLFHGTVDENDVNPSEFAADVIKLCGRIVLENAKAAGVHIPSVSQHHFELK